MRKHRQLGITGVKAKHYLSDILSHSVPGKRIRANELLLCMLLCNSVECRSAHAKHSPEKSLEEELESLRHSSAAMQYQFESPDEGCFVQNAQAMGYSMVKRTPEAIWIQVGSKILKFDILLMIPFSSTRKCMSVVVRNPSGEIVLYCKGAAEVLLPMTETSKQEPKTLLHEDKHETTGHSTKDEVIGVEKKLQEFGEHGFRTMMHCRRELTKKHFEAFIAGHKGSKQKEETSTKSKVPSIVKKLRVVGVTAVEDELQPEVATTLSSLTKAGITVWMITGDSIETAISVAQACKLLNRNQHQIYTLKGNDYSQSFHKMKNVSRELYRSHLFGLRDEQRQTALVVTGSIVDMVWQSCKRFKFGAHRARLCASAANNEKNLVQKALCDKESMMSKFASILVRCDTVVACRMNPTQKARLAKVLRICQPNDVAVAVGDGVNDIGMMQETNAAIAIAGEDGNGLHSVKDYAIPTFRSLSDLILVDGRNNLIRISFVIYYMAYKAMIFATASVLFNENSLFSGSIISASLTSRGWHYAFTSIPVIVMAMLDQDLAPATVFRFPEAYIRRVCRMSPIEGRFHLGTLMLWSFWGCFQGTIIYLILILENASQYLDFSTLGVTLDFYIVCVANLQLLLSVNRCKMLIVGAVIGSILCWGFAMYFRTRGEANPFIMEYNHPTGSPFLSAGVPIILASCLLPFAATRYFWNRLYPDSDRVFLEHEMGLRQLRYVAQQYNRSARKSLYRNVSQNAPEKPVSQSHNARNMSVNVHPLLKVSEGLSALSTRNLLPKLTSKVSPSKLPRLTITDNLAKRNTSDFALDSKKNENEANKDLQEIIEQIELITDRLEAQNGGLGLQIESAQGFGKNYGAMRLYSLKFEDPNLELRFMRYIVDRGIYLTMLILGLVTVLFLVFTLGDGNADSVTLFLRFMLVCMGGCLLSLFWLSGRTVRKYYTHLYYIAVALVSVIKNYTIALDGQLGEVLFLMGCIYAIPIAFRHRVVLSSMIMLSYATFAFSRFVQTERYHLHLFLQFEMCCLLLVFIGLQSAYRVEKAERLQYLEHSKHWASKRHAEKVLHNMMPSHVAERLKRGSSVIAEEEPNISVLFCDLVNFSEMYDKYSPAEMVSLLDSIYSLIDQICQQHGLHKMETVGKTYMACAGLQGVPIDHARSAVETGLDIVHHLATCTTSNQTGIEVRVGINSGDAIAGVVGKQKPQYCLFGDVVNTASRMQSTGVTNKVHISEATYQYIADQFDFEARTVTAKGKGTLKTYLVGNVISNHIVADSGIEIPSSLRTRSGRGSSSFRLTSSSSTTSVIEKTNGRAGAYLPSKCPSGKQFSEFDEATPKETKSNRIFSGIINAILSSGGSQVQPKRTISSSRFSSRRVSGEVHLETGLQDIGRTRPPARDWGRRKNNLVNPMRLSFVGELQKYEKEFKDTQLPNEVRSVRMATSCIAVLMVSMLLLDSTTTDPTKSLLGMYIAIVHNGLFPKYVFFSVAFVAVTYVPEYQRPKNRIVHENLSSLSLVLGCISTSIYATGDTMSYLNIAVTECLTLQADVELSRQTREGYLFFAAFQTSSIPACRAVSGFSMTRTVLLIIWVSLICNSGALHFKRSVGTLVAAFICSGILNGTIGGFFDLPNMVTSAFTLASFFVGSAVVLNLIAAYKTEVFLRESFVTTKETAKATAASNKILYQMLPRKIVQRISKYGRAGVDEYKQVSILFSDICSFTKISASMSASEVVKMLASLFSQFDSCTVARGVFKVQTIGDAYVIVSGMCLNDENAFNGAECEVEHTKRLLEMAKDMVRIVSNHSIPSGPLKGQKLRMRIGIHTGDIFGGVIGTTALRYDMWGRDVLIANQVETFGIPNKIVVSESTKNVLESSNGPKFEYHQMVPINNSTQGLRSYALIDES